MARVHRHRGRPGARTVAEVMSRAGAAGGDRAASAEVTVPALVRRETALAAGWARAGVTDQATGPTAATKPKPRALYLAVAGVTAALGGSIAGVASLSDAVSGSSSLDGAIAALPALADEAPRSQRIPAQPMGSGDAPDAAPAGGQPGRVPGDSVAAGGGVRADGRGAAGPAPATPEPAPANRAAPATVPVPAAAIPTERNPAPARDGGEQLLDGGERPPPDAGARSRHDGGQQRDPSAGSGGRSGEGDEASGDAGTRAGEPGESRDDRAGHAADRGDGEAGDADPAGDGDGEAGTRGDRQRAGDGDGERGGRHRPEGRGAENQGHGRERPPSTARGPSAADPAR